MDGNIGSVLDTTIMVLEEIQGYVNEDTLNVKDSLVMATQRSRKLQRDRDWKMLKW